MKYLGIVAAVLLVIGAGLGVRAVLACPFCSAVQVTLSEEIKNADAALIVKLAQAPAPPKIEPTAEGAIPPAEPIKTKFEVVRVLKGESLLGGKQQIETLYFGQHPAGTQFFVTGVDPKLPAWSTPTPLTDRSVAYLGEIVKLPEGGADRLAFFQQHFEDVDPLLAGDAYDEFAKAPYADVQALRPRMPRDKLIGWIQDPNVATSRRRLYLTMLGVCGQKEDIELLERLIRNEDRQVRTSLDALVACYLNLKGADGLPLVVDLFLANQQAEYTDTYATIMALRFHGTETDIVPREKLLAALRHMLARPQLADLVIPDLARWEDWSVIDRLVLLFKEAKEDSIWVRVPVINYLRACPLPEAKQRIDELAQIDPDAVKRASQFFPLGGAKPPASAVRPPDKQPPVAKPSSDGQASVPAKRDVLSPVLFTSEALPAAVLGAADLAVAAVAEGPLSAPPAPLPNGLPTKEAVASTPPPVEPAPAEIVEYIDETNRPVQTWRAVLLAIGGGIALASALFLILQENRPVRGV